MKQIVKREVWAELAPNRPMSKFPVGGNIDGWVCHWPGPWVNAEPLKELNGHNRYHQQTNRWAFLAYNFAIAPDGTVYEGRGFDYRNAANRGANGTTYSMLFLSTGTRAGVEVAPTSAALFAAGQLVAVHPGDGDVRPHSQVSSSGTQCPGDVIRAAIPTIKQVAGQPSPGPLPGPDPVKDDEMIANLYAAYKTGGRVPSPAELKAWVAHLRDSGQDLTDVCLWIAETVAGE